MLRQSEPIGAIAIYRTEVAPFPDRHIALLQTFANQAVIAVDNAHRLDLLAVRVLSRVFSNQSTNASLCARHGPARLVIAAYRRAAFRIGGLPRQIPANLPRSE